MTFHTTPPTKPGFYLWKTSDNSFQYLVHVSQTMRIFYGEAYQGKVEDGGLWCRLVPAEEVEKAWREGFQTALNLRYVCNWSIGESWNNSRAKRVMEGEV